MAADGGTAFKKGDPNSPVPNVLEPFGGEMMDPPVGACGPCEDGSISWRKLEVNLVQGRYATVFINFTVTAGNLVMTKPTDPLVAFAAGVKETYASAGIIPNTLTATRAETDAYSEGALGTNIASNFRVTGMQVMVGAPFLAGVTSGTDTGARQVLPALDFYAARMLRGFLANAHLKFRYGQAEGGFELGRPEFWPAGMGPLGADLPANGQPIARLFMPLRLPTWAGGPTDENAIEVDVTLDHTVTVVADPLVPVPALVAGTAYLLPVTIFLMGDPRNTQPLTLENVQQVVDAAVNQRMEAAARGMAAGMAAAGVAPDVIARAVASINAK